MAHRPDLRIIDRVVECESRIDILTDSIIDCNSIYADLHLRIRKIEKAVAELKRKKR